MIVYLENASIYDHVTETITGSSMSIFYLIKIIFTISTIIVASSIFDLRN